MNRYLTLTIISALILSCTNSKGGLQEKTQTLELTYISWACDCANWATENDIKKYSGNSLMQRSIFIEPANKKLKLPDTLGYNADIIKFTGKFYNERGYPKGYHSYQDPEKSRVFRYTEFQVLKSNYSKYEKLVSSEKSRKDS